MPKPGERGVALLIVLWILLLLSLLGAAFLATSRSTLLVARNSTESARAEALADAGITRGVLALQDPNPAFQWRADGTPHVWRFGGGTVTVSMRAEGGKVDLNAASEDVLAGLFREAGANDALSQSLADEIAARRGNADTVLPQNVPDGTIDPNEPPFATVDDLARLPGMTAALFHAVEPLVTIYSRVPTVDPMTASREVLLALPNADPAEIDAFLAQRSAYDPANPKLPAPPPGLAQYLGGSASSAVTIRSDAVTDTGARFIREALIEMRDLRGVPFAVERWTEAVAP
jgi:general secretion pathway protein K